MRKTIIRFFIVGVLTTMMASLSFPGRAEDKTEAPGQTHKSNKIPFHGKITAVDKVAMTITLAGKEKPRTIQITSQTKIMKAGKPATFDDATLGEEVGGSAHQLADGKLEATSLRIGPKPEGKTKSKSSETK